MLMNKIKWIFFDIGSTLVDESAVYENRILTEMSLSQRLLSVLKHHQSQ